MFSAFTLPLALGILAQGLTAIATFSLDPSICVDPSGMESCLNDVSNFQQTCATQYCPLFQQFTCPAICQATTYQNNLACIYNHCWNQLYSCYAQDLALDAFSFTSDSLPTANQPPQMLAVPYSAGCSCPIFAGYYIVRYYKEYLLSQCNQESNGAGLGNECYACGFSGMASTMPQVCPGVNADQVDTWFQGNADEAASSLGMPTYSAALAQATCTAQSIGYTTFVDSFTFYQAAAIPSGTTLPSDSGTLTSPPYSPTTWALAAGGSTVTLSPVSSGAGQGGASPSANGGASGAAGSGGGGAASSAGSNAPSSVPKSSALKSSKAPLVVAVGGILVGMIVIVSA